MDDEERWARILGELMSSPTRAEVTAMRYSGDIHADVEDSAETIAARINELYQAMLAVESCGAHPLLTDAVGKLGERMRELRRIAPQYIHYDS